FLNNLEEFSAMTNIKLISSSVKSPNKLLELINRARSILKIQNLFKVNKLFKKSLAVSLSTIIFKFFF
ncbi:MAG: hypothetical protein LBJ32_01150, partial [Oscillospiraceae bacterium]|nr:hypothetical protein [Oscillospiraceae bacterium]